MSVHEAQLRLNPQAMTAPNVTISPWAKFDKPVVPKISDSPIDVIAMIVASFNPFARTWGSWLHLPSVMRRSWPRKNPRVLGVVRGELDGEGVLALGDGQPLGQGVLVEADDVRSRFVDRDEVVPVGVGGALGHQRAVLGLDHDADVRHALLDALAVLLVLVAHVALDGLRGALGLGVRGGGTSQHAATDQHADDEGEPCQPPTGPPGDAVRRAFHVGRRTYTSAERAATNCPVRSPAEARELLGVDGDAGAEAVHRAWRRLAKELHPDVGGDGGAMQRLNEAAEVLLRDIAGRGAIAPPPRRHRRRRHRPPPRPPRRRRRAAQGRGQRVDHDVASFVIEALPVEAFEALLVATSWIGEALVDEPPYLLDVVLTDPLRCWCRLELVPDAGASTVSLTIAAVGDEALPDIDAVRDLWVSTLNQLGADEV